MTTEQLAEAIANGVNSAGFQFNDEPAMLVASIPAATPNVVNVAGDTGRWIITVERTRG